jgi:hypothetical protein
MFTATVWQSTKTVVRIQKLAAVPSRSAARPVPILTVLATSISAGSQLRTRSIAGFILSL